MTLFAKDAIPAGGVIATVSVARVRGTTARVAIQAPKAVKLTVWRQTEPDPAA